MCSPHTHRWSINKNRDFGILRRFFCEVLCVCVLISIQCWPTVETPDMESGTSPDSQGDRRVSELRDLTRISFSDTGGLVSWLFHLLWVWPESHQRECR